MLDSQLFPPAARYCYVRTMPNTEEPNLLNYKQLHPLEQTLVSQSLDVRKSEFGDARWCAHQALRELGAIGQEPILKGERGMPLWPEGFVGSITHTSGFRAAVAARAEDIWSLGLDAEPSEPLPRGVLKAIARKEELQRVEELKRRGIEYSDRLLFCAKEATYKAWFPLTFRFLDFDEADIDLREDGTLTAYILARPTPVPLIHGKWLAKDGYVVVSTTIEHRQCSALV